MSTGDTRSLSIVVTTYEWPAALELVLRSLSEAVDRHCEVVVADDGSGPSTAAVVERWQGLFPVHLGYVRQDDHGWRQARSRNLGALTARGEYLVFIDGDALVRPGLVSALRRAMIPGWFLASKRLNLSNALTERILGEDLPVWRWSAIHWLVLHPRELLSSARAREPNRPGVLLPLRDQMRPWRSNAADFTPPHHGYGFLTGLWRTDLERVNGFEARFIGWGEEDVEMGLRLRRAGLRCGWAGPGTSLLHLWHRDRYETTSGNWPLYRETESSARLEALDGLRELACELAGVA